jgi:hypothetical protein
MPAAGRSHWTCGSPTCCDGSGNRTRLAVVRGEYPHRRLQVCLGVPQAQHREDGSVIVHCPSCGRDNKFEWLTVRSKEP